MGLESKFQDIMNEPDEEVKPEEKPEETTKEEPEQKQEITKEPEAINTNVPEPPKEQAKEPEKPEEKLEPEKYILKINGEDKEFSKDELISAAQKATGAELKFKEAAGIRDQIENVLKTMKTNPWGVLQKLGVDTKKMAEELLLQEIEYQNMSEPERKLKEITQENEYLKTQQDALKKQQEDMIQAGEIQRLQEDYQRQIIAVMEKSTLPKTEAVAKRVIRTVLDAKEQGQDISFEQAMKTVENDVKTELKEIYGKLEGERLYNELGEDIVKKIKTEELKKIKKPENNIQKPGEQTTPRKKKEKKTWAEIKAEINDLVY